MIFLVTSFFVSLTMASIPAGFVSLNDICPQMKFVMSYATPDNFTGEIVDGYKAQKAFLSETAAIALCRVQKNAEKQGLTLKIFDSYRPVK